MLPSGMFEIKLLAIPSEMSPASWPSSLEEPNTAQTSQSRGVRKPSCQTWTRTTTIHTSSTRIHTHDRNENTHTETYAETNKKKERYEEQE